MEQKNEIIHNEITRLTMSNENLVKEMREIIKMMNQHSDFDYGDTESLFTLSQLLNEKLMKYSKNETSSNMIKWTLEEINKNK